MPFARTHRQHPQVAGSSLGSIARRSGPADLLVGISPGNQTYALVLHARAIAIAHQLLDAQRAVLVEVATPALLGLPDPYVPLSPEQDHVAATLAHPWFGLLAADRAGFVPVYRPTPLGLLVLRVYLLERVAGVRLMEDASYARQ